MSDFRPKLNTTSVSLWKNEKWSKGGKLPYFRGSITIPEDARPGEQYDISFWVNDNPKNDKSPHLTGRVAEPYKKSASKQDRREAVDDLPF